MSNSRIEIAQILVDKGISLVPIKADGSKAPAILWKEFQEKIPTKPDLHAWFGNGNNYGIAIVCGSVSGGLEILDFDAPAIYPQWCELVIDENATLFGKLTIIKTPSGGFHVLYQCIGVEGNQKLAQQFDKEGKPQVLIETRGQGGYALTVGSPPECHPVLKSYEFIQGDFQSIPTISEKERQLLLDCARQFNEIIKPKRVIGNVSTNGNGRPGDDYNSCATWGEILTPAGWKFVREVSGSKQWRKPNKNGIGISATTNYNGSDLFYVFSTNAPPFEAECAYTKFAAYALLHHNGDYSAAAKELASKGFGKNTNASAEGNQEIDWPEPEPIKEELKPVPVLEQDMLPAVLWDYAADVSERMGCSIDYVAVAELAILGSVIGTGCGIRPKKYDDWLAVPNLWGAVVGRPGSMKSPAIEEPLHMLSLLEAEANEKHEEAIKTYQAEVAVVDAQKAVLQKKMKAAADKELNTSVDKEQAVQEENESDTDTDINIDAGNGLEDLKQKLINLEEAKHPSWRRFKTNDSSVEKVHEILADNPRGLLVWRDEIIGFLKRIDLEGNETDRAFYLESWKGNGKFTIDRIGRGSIFAKQLCVAIFGSITPSKLMPYLTQVVDGTENDWLIQRFQLMVYPDLEGHEPVDRTPNDAAARRVEIILKKLAELDVAPSPGDNIPYVHFDDAAQKKFDDWYSDHLSSIQISNEHPAICEHLSKYSKLMPGLALIFHLVHLADRDGRFVNPTNVCADCAEKAIAWCDYLEKHARRIYGIVIGSEKAAVQLAKKIKSGVLLTGFTMRDVYTNGWSELDTAEKVEVACELLELKNWLRRKPSKPGEQGGRPTVLFLINSKVQGPKAA